MTTDHQMEMLEAVQRPIETAQGLANPHYIDPGVFEEEKHAVLFSSWSALAVVADVPNVGDAKPVEFLGVPLLLIRDKAGIARVFQNICRHRGMILVSKARKFECAIRCPYHSWCYAPDGKLISTPHVGGPGHNTHDSIDKATLGLIEVRSHIWFETVFINVDGTAPPFKEVHADLIERWAEFDQPMFHGGEDSSFRLEAKTNWKLAVENYCESYHLPWIHPGMNRYSRMEDHYNIEKRHEYSGQGTLVYRQIQDDEGNAFPDFQALSEKWETGGEYLAVYPNVLLGVQRDHTFVIILEPVTYEQTSEHIHLFYAAAETDAAFDGGRFSPVMDAPTLCFHDWVAGRIVAHRAK